MPTVDLDDIQGIILRGYGKFPISKYLFLQVGNHALAKRWLNQLVPRIHPSRKGGNYDQAAVPDPVCNIAFTFDGLLALGLTESNTSGFVNEFREGMVTPHRQRLLGDFGVSDPENWRWGGPTNDKIHVLLLLYAANESSMEAWYQSQLNELSSHDLRVVSTQDGLTLPEQKEHFGFRDGIGQPVVKGVDEEGPQTNRVATGEFILGYPNEYGVLPDSPLIKEAQGDIELLSIAADGSGRKDLGRNGSYLVFRQLSQDVQEFWRFLSEAPHVNGNYDPDPELAMIKLASKMVGRWPSGAPMVLYPNQDPGGVNNEDDFAYRDRDPLGEQCPIGSHVRRTNPRDSLQDSTGDQSTTIVNHHRIIRRGRVYGKQFSETMNPRDLLRALSPNHEVGLHFICFNANISNQFQFIQFNWIGSPKFERFYNDPDPLVGVQGTGPRAENPIFTLPEKPIRATVRGLKRFVEVRGGAYLFMPGIRAIRFIASIQ